MLQMYQSANYSNFTVERKVMKVIAQLILMTIMIMKISIMKIMKSKQ